MKEDPNKISDTGDVPDIINDESIKKTNNSYLNKVNLAVLISFLSLLITSFGSYVQYFTWNSLVYKANYVKTDEIGGVHGYDAVFDCLIEFYNNGNRPVALDQMVFTVITSLSKNKEQFHDNDCLSATGTIMLSLFEDKSNPQKSLTGDSTTGFYGNRKIPSQIVAPYQIGVVNYRHSIYSQLNDAVSSLDGLVCFSADISDVGGREVHIMRPLTYIKAVKGRPITMSEKGIESMGNLRKVVWP